MQQPKIAGIDYITVPIFPRDQILKAIILIQFFKAFPTQLTRTWSDFPFKSYRRGNFKHWSLGFTKHIMVGRCRVHHDIPTYHMIWAPPAHQSTIHPWVGTYIESSFLLPLRPHTDLYPRRVWTADQQAYLNESFWISTIGIFWFRFLHAFFR